MTRAALVFVLLFAARAAFADGEPVDPAVRNREDALRAQRSYDAGRYAGSVSILRALHARGGGDGATFALLGHGLYALEKPKEARAAFVEALARGRLSSDVVLRLVEIDRARGDPVAVLEGLRLAGLLLPDDERLPLAAADAAVDAGRLDEAESAYRRVLDRTPDAADVFLRLGNLYLKQQRHDDALVAFRTADALGATGATRLVAELYLACDDYQAAAAAYERMLAEEAGDAELELRCAELELAAGDRDAAVRHGAHVAATASGAVAGRARVLLGRAKLAGGDTDGAMGEFEKALEAGEGGTELHVLLGMHFHRAGEHARAVKHLRAALKDGGPDRARQTALVESLLALDDVDAARQETVRLIESFGIDERVERLVARLAAAAARPAH
jgi:tetratricopeptide (TPR) repeat protein